MRAMAPGGGASVTRWTMPTAWPASPSSSASRGAWSLARTTRAFSPTQCSTPSTRRSVRPGGSTGSRQPNWSPLVRLFEANAMPSAAPASDCQVSSSVLRAVEVALPVARRQVGGRPVLRQVARLDQLRVPLLGLAPQEVGGVGEVAGLVEHEEGRRVEVVEAGRRRDDASPDLGGVAGGQRAALDGLGARRGVAGEALEVLGEAVGQAGGHPAEALPDHARAAGRQQELGRGQEGDLADGADAALVGGVEGAQGVDLVAEQLDPDRQGRRRREHVDDAAASRELAPAGDLDHGRVAALEQLGDQRVEADPHARPEGADVRRQVVGRDRRLDQRLDAGDEDLRGARSPRGEGGDPGRGLVGDELAALVGQRRPGLQDRDQRRVAEPGAQLLRHPVADLGVAGDPADPLGVGREGEGRGEVRLRPVRDGRQPDVLAVLAGRDVRLRRAARAASRTRRCRGAASGGPPGPARAGRRHGTTTRSCPGLALRPAAWVGPRSRRPLRSAFGPRRRIEQLDLGLDRCLLEVELLLGGLLGGPPLRPLAGDLLRDVPLAGRASAVPIARHRWPPFALVPPAPSSPASSAPPGRIFRQPVFVRRMPLSSAGPPTSPAFGRSPSPSVSAGAWSSKLFHRLAAFDVPSLAQASTASAEASSRIGSRARSSTLERRQHVVDRPPRRVPDADP